MGRQAVVVVYVLVMVAVVVGVDVLFFRHELWERLISNIGIVVVFGAFYLRFLNRPGSRQLPKTHPFSPAFADVASSEG
jgi:hypothetical protein